MALNNETIHDSTIITDLCTSDSNMWDSDFSNVSNLARLMHNLITYVRNLWNNTTLDSIYPVGSIYISTSNTNPASLFGGRWNQIRDSFLVGVGSYFRADEVGGDYRNLSISTASASHSHTVSTLTPDTGSAAGTTRYDTSSALGGSSYYCLTEQNPSYDVLPPYRAVYMWERVG